MAGNEEGFYWVKRGADWTIGELTHSKLADGEDYWEFVGTDEAWPDPGGEVGPKIEPPEWVVEFPGGTTHGPFTRDQAMVYLAKQYPGHGAEMKKL